jgi:hypothetical protein
MCIGGLIREAVSVAIVPIVVATIAITAVIAVIASDAATEPSVAEAATEASAAEAAMEASTAEAAVEPPPLIRKPPPPPCAKAGVVATETPRASAANDPAIDLKNNVRGFFSNWPMLSPKACRRGDLPRRRFIPEAHKKLNTTVGSPSACFAPT